MKSKPLKNAPKTHSELAKALGVTRQLITAAASKPDAPKVSDVAGWREYIAAHGRTGSLPPDLRRKIAEKKLAILDQQEIAARRENQIKAGEMMLTADAERQACEAMSLTFAELERRDRELPPSLAGLDAVSIFKRMRADTEQIRKTLKEKFEEVGK